MKRDYIADIIMCGFQTGEEKAYFASDRLHPGDKVIIETNKGKLKIVEVTRTENLTAEEKKQARKWIVQRVNLIPYRRKKTEQIELARI